MVALLVRVDAHAHANVEGLGTSRQGRAEVLGLLDELDIFN